MEFCIHKCIWLYFINHFGQRILTQPRKAGCVLKSFKSGKHCKIQQAKEKNDLTKLRLMKLKRKKIYINNDVNNSYCYNDDANQVLKS